MCRFCFGCVGDVWVMYVFGYGVRLVVVFVGKCFVEIE